MAKYYVLPWQLSEEQQFQRKKFSVSSSFQTWGLSMNSLIQRRDTEARNCQSVMDSWDSVTLPISELEAKRLQIQKSHWAAASCLLRTCFRAIPILGWETASSWGIHADFHFVFLNFTHQQTTDYSHSWKSSLCLEMEEWFNTYSDSLTTESYRNEFKYSITGKFTL